MWSDENGNRVYDENQQVDHYRREEEKRDRAIQEVSALSPMLL
jgi:hypothetical protein